MGPGLKSFPEFDNFRYLHKGQATFFESNSYAVMTNTLSGAAGRCFKGAAGRCFNVDSFRVQADSESSWWMQSSPDHD